MSTVNSDIYVFCHLLFFTYDIVCHFGSSLNLWQCDWSLWSHLRIEEQPHHLVAHSGLAFYQKSSDHVFSVPDLTGFVSKSSFSFSLKNLFTNLEFLLYCVHPESSMVTEFPMPCNDHEVGVTMLRAKLYENHNENQPP